MKQGIHIILLGSVAFLAQPALAHTSPVPPTVVLAPADDAQRLKALFAASDEDSLKLNPNMALSRGDMRYADQIGNNLTDKYEAAAKAAAEKNLAGLANIDRSKLNETDQLAYDVFEYSNKQALKNYSDAIRPIIRARPMNHFYGPHTGYPTFSSGKGTAPFKTLADYDNALTRHAQYPGVIDAAIARFREGKANGYLETKLTVTNMIAQIDAQLAQSVEDSSYFGPIKMMPASFTPADKARLEAAYRTAIAQNIHPSLVKLRDYLQTDYLPSAREGVGLMHMKDGAAYYQHLMDQTLTIHMTPDEVHNLGLSEVARIKKGMEDVRTEVGFKGNLTAFFDYLRTDPKFKKPSREALTQGYYDIGKTVDTKIGALFSTIPKTKLEIRPYEEFREKYEAGGSYNRGTPDGSRPGIFYFNAYNLPERTTPGMTTLYLHEGAPGHHFQNSLAQENTALPNFLRFGGFTAFGEGWGLYAETLGQEMGLYKDPYQRFGTLSAEMHRAMRLVVDTGIHAKGWTRDQAVQYMLDNSNMGRSNVEAEVDRYIAIPSQALAYKIGALTMLRLRDKAQKALGPKFDIKDFHDQILMTGRLPLEILEAKIDRWIAAKK